MDEVSVADDMYCEFEDTFHLNIVGQTKWK
jgi:hypothetical protein